MDRTYKSTVLNSPHAYDTATVFTALGSSEQGLDKRTVAERQLHYGPNALPTSPPTSAWKRFLSQFHNVLIYVLLVSALISLVLQHTVDSGVIVAVVLVNAVVGFIQEGKAEQALRAILQLSKTHSLVFRSGTLLEVESSQLVPGDIVTLQAGDRVPADLRLFYCKNLRCDESALTGESQPVDKCTDPVPTANSLAVRKNMAYMGTMVTYGTARGLVCGTGLSTEIGTISSLVQRTRLPKTPLQIKLTTFAQQLSVTIVLIALATMVFGTYFRDYSFTTMFQAAIGIAVASIPEGLPAIVTITLAIGVQRMARSHAIVRRLPSVEVLGSVDVICSDKTGTLTTNAMTARQLINTAGDYRISGEGYRPEGSIREETTRSVVELGHDPLLNRACLLAMLCNDANLTETNGEYQLHGDPTEGALLVLAMKHGCTLTSTRMSWPRIDELPFETERRYMATLHRDNEGNEFLAVKGAPDRLLGFSSTQLGENGPQPIQPDFWVSAINRLAEQGMRVIALAEKAVVDKAQALGHPVVEDNLTLVALVGISDPPRPEAIDSVRQCHAAGITVKMITGDSPITARSIGKELGLKTDQVLEGEVLDTLTPAQIAARVAQVDIFARTSPTNKLQLVNGLRQQRHIVAMTGDGVNDAPALRQADIGVAMGHKGTDAAKEASDIVLSDDNFSTIAQAVAEGRTVYDNIVKSILFILPTNLAEASVIIVAIISGSLLPITPAQIIWVNMVTAVTLALSLAFEKPEPNLMRRSPKPGHQGLITPSLVTRMLLVGFLAAAIVFWLFTHYRTQGASIEQARTVAVNALVMFEAVYLLNCRFLSPARLSKTFLRGALPSLVAIASVVVLQLGFTFWPLSQQLFGLAPLDAGDALLMLAMTVPLFFIVEAEKQIWRALHHKQLAQTS